MMVELSAVEWDHNFDCYVATLSDGEFFLLESKNLREAEQEAQRVIDQYND
jgi:hypothetical protein